MKLNRFNIKIIIYAALIAFTGFMAYKSLFEKHLIVTYLSWILAWMILLFLLIRMLNRTNIRLKNFLESLQYLDNLSQVKDNDQTFTDLNLSFNNIINRIKSVKKDKEAQGIYFKNTVEHVNIGLISFNSSGEVKMINKAARNLLNTVSNIEDLNKIKKGLRDEIIHLKPQENRVFSLIINNQLNRISLKKAQLKLLDEELNVVSLQDIRLELEEEEIEAWQKLIKILRHEIMNSAAPINSLSNSLIRLSEKIKNDLEPSQAEMMIEGLEAISSRSKGMMTFVEAYKNLTNIPSPVFSEFQLRDLLDEIKQLYGPTIKERGIHFNVKCSINHMTTADYNLLSQGIINLVKNAFQAVEDNRGIISIESSVNKDGSTKILFSDNGKGIPEDETDKVFIPFYTTKEEGSGIGLSLTRQIIRLHKGTIRVRSKPGDTVFEIII